MDSSVWLWPSGNMDFWKINNTETTININWSHDHFKDYKDLSYQFYECGYQTFLEIINSGHDNIKSDTWFLTAIFLIRQSIELGLKALLCRCYRKNSDIQEAFKQCKHNVVMLFQKYINNENNYLTIEEKEWLDKYFNSLEIVDAKSDMFRFPFDDEFLSQYRDKFLNSISVANNLLQAFALVKKCIENGSVSDEDKFDNIYKPKFFIFASHGIGNCYLYQSILDDGFHAKVTGYNKVIDFIFKNHQISNENKFYPLMFMFRNTLELCLKRMLYSKVDNNDIFNKLKSKRKSHLIKKDLWANLKPYILKYANDDSDDPFDIEIVERVICEISSLDKNGDMFRYPTSYSLEYRFDNKKVDIENIYEYFKALINFLDGCDSMLYSIAEFQSEMISYYEI